MEIRHKREEGRENGGEEKDINGCVRNKER